MMRVARFIERAAASVTRTAAYRAPAFTGTLQRNGELMRVLLADGTGRGIGDDPGYRLQRSYAGPSDARLRVVLRCAIWAVRYLLMHGDHDHFSEDNAFTDTRGVVYSMPLSPIWGRTILSLS